MNREDELLEIIRGLVKLPFDIQETVAKAFELLVDDDLVIKNAVEKFTKGKLTQEQFLDVAEKTWRARFHFRLAKNKESKLGMFSKDFTPE